MKRQIIDINENKCNGCGLCINACHEEALVLENGKAKLVRDDYCDGLGTCLPVCPMGAISFIEREALPFNEATLFSHFKNQENGNSQSSIISELKNKILNPSQIHSKLSQWPLKISLVNSKSEFLKEAELLIAADCTAFAYGNFHSEFIQGRITLIGCPKFAVEDYTEKLAEILKINSVKSVLLVKMAVPCCSKLETMLKNALEFSGADTSLIVKTISLEGNIL